MNILNAAFAHPQGLLGRLGGMIMARSSGLRNEWIISLLDVQRDDRILEVGFGPGVVIQSLATKAPEGFIAGIDASPLMVPQASKLNAQAIRDGRVHLQQGSALALPYEDASFDIALSINSVQIWPDSLAGVKEMQRVLKPGGLIALALQPVWVREDSEVRKIGADLVTLLDKTGFLQTRLEFKPMKPMACVCALGIK
jgi:ubiquinone/menaquinone biosynthesis C-methylase UbiE